MITTLFNLAWQQHDDPVAFLRGESSADRRLWRVAWLFRGGTVLFVLITLSIAAALSQSSGVLLVAHAILSTTLPMLFTGLAVTITHHPQFWFLYLYSPPMWAIALLCGLGPLVSAGYVLGWGIGVPLFISTLLLDAGTLWIHNQTFEARRDRTRRRAGGPISELPALALWNRLRIVRLIAAIGCALLAVGIVLYWQEEFQSAFVAGLAFLTCAAGCLRLDATLIALLSNLPLVTYDEQLREWRPTYLGRSIMFAPQKHILRMIESDEEENHNISLHTSAALLALLNHSSLGPVIRPVVRKLSPEQVHRLSLLFSLQEGGATAIRYLQPVLIPALQSTTRLHAALADEATKPFNVQRWMTLLGKQLNGRQDDAFEPAIDVTHTLAYTRDALLSYEYQPVLETALRDLRQLIHVLYGISVPSESGEQLNQHAQLENEQRMNRSGKLDSLPMSWPVALLTHVENHRRGLAAK